MITFCISLVLLILGYLFYGKFVEKVFGPDDRITPALRINDGVDYILLPSWKIFMIQFLNIAGTGPIFGAIMGAKFGPAAYLWIVFGCIFAGATHDYLSGMLSIRNNGAGLPVLVGKYLGNGVKNVMLVFTVLLLGLVGAVFVKGLGGSISTKIDSPHAVAGNRDVPRLVCGEHDRRPEGERALLMHDAALADRQGRAVDSDLIGGLCKVHAYSPDRERRFERMRGGVGPRDHVVRAAGQEKLRVRVPGNARQHERRAFFLEQRRDLQRRLQIVAHGHDANVEILHAQRIDQRRVRGVPDLGVGHIAQGVLHLSFVLIDGQHLMMQIGKLLRHVPSKPAEADQQYVSHFHAS